VTKEEFAKLLDGREIGHEIDRAEGKLAKDNGLVVVFGACDDLCELYGAIDDEVGRYNGGTIPLLNGKLLPNHDEDNCDCEFCGYKELRANAKIIEAIWDEPGAAATWTYKTDIPHATFRILEDGEPYCQGIVFDVSEVK
jgi:hypothetical protein